MSNSQDKVGGQAFPQPVAYTPLGQEVPSYPGMTLRDYFAAKALAGMLADPNVRLGDNGTKIVAALAFEVADAMLAAREAQ